MLDNIRKSSFKVKWNLREVHIITEWKNDCVYRTKSIGMIVCSPEYVDMLRAKSRNIIVGPVSTRISKMMYAQKYYCWIITKP